MSGNDKGRPIHLKALIPRKRWSTVLSIILNNLTTQITRRCCKIKGSQGKTLGNISGWIRRIYQALHPENSMFVESRGLISFLWNRPQISITIKKHMAVISRKRDISDTNNSPTPKDWKSPVNIGISEGTIPQLIRQSKEVANK